MEPLTNEAYRQLIAESDRWPGTYVETRGPNAYTLQIDNKRAEMCAAVNTLLCAVLMVLCLRCLRVSFNR